MPIRLPLVSVVVPAFNAAASLQQTLDSVLAQSFPSFEIIVVDDGSQDATAAIAGRASARDGRIRVVHQRNAGVGAARNAGLRLARGKYIAPLDADDLWSPRKLERQIARLERAGPKAGLVYCWSRNVDEHNRILRWSHPYRIEGRVGSAMMLGNFVGSASVPLFRASALAAVGEYLTRNEQNGAQGCEDWDLNIRVAEKFSLCCVPEYLVSYRQCGCSMSLDARGMAKSYDTAIRRASARNAHLAPALLAWSASRFYSYLASKCYSWSDYSGALYCIGRVLQVDPVAWINLRNYRLGSLALAHLLSGGRFRRHRAPPPVTSAGDPEFKQLPPATTPPRDLFTHIEERRLDVALKTRRLNRRMPVKVHGAFGY